MQLMRVPSIHQDQNLQIRLTSAGLTILKTSKFKSRYTGSKRHAVDINGRLCLDANQLKKEIAAAKGIDKKKARVKTQAMVISLNEKANLQNLPTNLPTDHPGLLTNESELSTVKKEREYKIKKSLIRQRLLAWIRTQKGKKELYFWTVSFPAGIPDQVAYQIYNIWLTSLRQYKMLKNYLWIAERQENGTVHFHIAIPHKMRVQRANAMMAGTLKTFAKRKMIPFTVHQCKRYNGVDIAKNRQTKRVTNFAIKKGSRALANYLTKYITKNENTFNHLAWHNSRGFSALFLGIALTPDEVYAAGLDAWVNEFKGFDSEFFYFLPWCAAFENRGSPVPAFIQHIDQLNNYTQSLLN